MAAEFSGVSPLLRDVQGFIRFRDQIKQLLIVRGISLRVSDRDVYQYIVLTQPEIIGMPPI
jgi:hypothetical protein